VAAAEVTSISESADGVSDRERFVAGTGERRWGEFRRCPVEIEPKLEETQAAECTRRVRSPKVTSWKKEEELKEEELIDAERLSDYHLARLPEEGGTVRMKRALLKIVSCLMAVVFPVAMFAADQPAAMLYSHGSAMLNGSSITRSSAIFSGDMVQTTKDSVANINASGSTVLVLNDSIVQYQGTGVKLEHGGVTISTSKLMATHAGAVTVLPASGAWTEFEVRDTDGTVRIAARKGDLTISDDKGTMTLAQGQETTRDEGQPRDKKGRKREGAGSVPGATGGVLDSPVAIGVGAAIIGGVTAWVLIKSDDPASPVN